MSSADIDSDLIPADEWYDPYLRFALYLGGAFQLVCILAVLFLPSEGGHRNTSNEEGDDFDSEDDSSSSEEEDAAGANVSKGSRHRQQNRGNKKTDKRSKKQR